MKSDSVTIRQRRQKRERFVGEFLANGGNATLAYLAIVPTCKRASASTEGFKLLRIPEVAAAIAARLAKQLEKADLSATRTLEEMRRLGFSNIKTLFDEVGNLKDIHTLTDEQAACVASVEVVKRNLVAGAGIFDTVIKVKLWDKVRALEMLGKHFALLIEQVHLVGDAELLARLDAIKARNALKRSSS